MALSLHQHQTNAHSKTLILGALLFVLTTFVLLSNCYAKPLISKQEISELVTEHGDRAGRRLVAWKNLINNSQQKSLSKKLALVNDFFNQFTFVSDISFVGEPDYWMTPVEFIVEGAGDCEDFSIAKYFTLIALGVPMDKLRVMYVKSLSLNQAHMVLAYYENPEDEPKILDNLKSKIVRASQRTDLLPIYSFNGDGLWLNKLREQASRVGSSSSLSKWRRVLQRMGNKRNQP